jgi:hypothetical protein
MAKKKPHNRARTEELPIRIRRSGIISQRVGAVVSDVRLGEEEGPLLTRTGQVSVR